MKRIKALAFGLMLMVTGVVYAAGTSAVRQSAPRACDMNKAGAICCAPEGASCCGGGASCCKTDKAGHQLAAQTSGQNKDAASCCQDGASCCRSGASCCAAHKGGEKQKQKQQADVTREEGASCCVEGASCYSGGSCCRAKTA